MDSVRFGRALGFGARQAAKAVVSAFDAAISANPSAGQVDPARAHLRTSTGVRPASPPRSGPAVSTARAFGAARETGKGVARGGRLFGQAVWGPFVKLSGVLWLELTGVFFGIFTAFALQAVWKDRDSARQSPTNGPTHQHFLWACLMAAVFGYFCISSFVRASRRGRSS